MRCPKEAYLPEGPDGPEIDVSVPLTRQIFETAAADVLKRLKEAGGDMLMKYDEIACCLLLFVVVLL